MPTPGFSDTRLKSLNRFSIVIVTGGSSGIGFSFIKAILDLSPDVHLCNLSRSEPDFFLGENGVHLCTNLSDSQSLSVVAEQVIDQIDQSPEGEILLINNSGFGDYGKFDQLDNDKQLNMLDLNIRAVVDLTQRLMPKLLERGGVVLNVASTAAFQPTPYLATYGATKAFVLNWSLAINEDLRGTGVRAIAVCPGPTRSNFFQRAGFETPPMGNGPGKGMMDMTAEEVVLIALQGLAKGKSLVVTGWQNKCVVFLSSKMPRALIARVAAVILRKLRLEQHASSQK